MSFFKDAIHTTGTYNTQLPWFTQTEFQLQANHNKDTNPVKTNKQTNEQTNKQTKVYQKKRVFQLQNKSAVSVNDNNNNNKNDTGS